MSDSPSPIPVRAWISAGLVLVVLVLALAPPMIDMVCDVVHLLVGLF